MDIFSWRSWTERPGSPLLPASSALWLLPSFLVRASPLIRYQTGDLGFIDDKKFECGLKLPQMGLRGRNEDQVVVQEKIYSPFFIEELLMQIPEVGNWYELVPRVKKLLVRTELMPGVAPSKAIEAKNTRAVVEKSRHPRGSQFCCRPAATGRRNSSSGQRAMNNLGEVEAWRLSLEEFGRLVG